ncbi:hypothetical protein EGT07_04635 [Herbaspirillum sp. HC18]|nr:hypothetical protein EGT07_04635 [Herbaspirillum sp. HC18]
MQSSPRRLVNYFAIAAGALGFLLSFFLAATMLLQRGNPGFLLIWLLAVSMTAACMRVHARWRKSFDRIYDEQAARIFYPARREWKLDVEDVMFRDLPDAAAVS